MLQEHSLTSLASLLKQQQYRSLRSLFQVGAAAQVTQGGIGAAKWTERNVEFLNKKLRFLKRNVDFFLQNV